MAMEWVRPCSIAALLFLTLVLAAATASGGGGDDDAAAAVEEEQQRHPPGADQPYMLTTFHKDGGEEIRLLGDKGSELLSTSGFANRSGHWFFRFRNREAGDERKRRRRRLLPQPTTNYMSHAEVFWNALGVLANTTAASGGGDDDDEGYVLVGLQTSGGDKIRLVVVADRSYFLITGFAKGWFIPPRWSFRDGERHRLLPTVGGKGSSSSRGGGSSSSRHAEVVASSVLAAMMNAAGEA